MQLSDFEISPTQAGDHRSLAARGIEKLSSVPVASSIVAPMNVPTCSTLCVANESFATSFSPIVTTAASKKLKLKWTWQPVTFVADATAAPERPRRLTWCCAPGIEAA